MRKSNVKNAIVRTIAFVSATAMLSTSFSTISFAKEAPDDTDKVDSAYSKVVESNLTEDVALDENEEVAFDEVDDAKVVLLEDADSETAEEIVAEDAGTEEAEDEDAEIDEVSEAADLEAEEAGSEDSEVADVENEDVDAVDAETDEVDAEATEAVEADDAGAVEVDIEAETEEVEAEEIDIEEEVSIANELAVVKNGWEKQSDGTYKYYENGTALTYTVKKIGNDYFGFDDNGIMYDDEEFEIYDGNDVWYRAKKGGYLYVNSWYVDNWGNKYYYGAGGGTNVGDTVLKIDGVNYLFYNGGALFIYGSAEINGVTYVSDKDGKAYALKKNGWTKVGEDWYYLDKNGSYNSYSVFRDGGKYYFWMDDGRVLCNDYTFSDGYAYRAKDDCSLFVNEWYISEYGSKYYYGAEGKASTNDCVQTIGGKQYLFEGYGQLNINGTSTIDGVIYISDAFGIATKASQNGWCKCGDYWYYFENGSKITSKVKKIGSFYFGFDYNGHMYANRLFSMNRYNANGTYIGTGYYYADSEGHLYINKWKLDNGNWYYFGAEGVRALGWQTIGGTKYFFSTASHDGRMMKSCYVLDGNDIYRLGSDGVAKKISNPNNLFYDVYQNFAVYYENGTLVKDAWKQINGKWFYFNYNGTPIHGATQEIGNANYAFNADGTMATTGWVKLQGNTYYVKNDNGVLATGQQKIGDKWYYFANSGVMRTGKIDYNGKLYILNPDGSWAATAKEGWNSVQGTWYYVKNGNFVTGKELQLADGNYYFNKDGAMVKNEVVNQKYYGADGKQVTKTGWYKVGTKWIYIQNGSMLYSGAKTINGTEYAFDYDGFLVTNDWYNGVYYNADGIAVKKSTIKDGWQLYGGKYYYYKNGSSVFNTWVGDYYIGYDGCLQTNRWTLDNYFVGKDGKYVKNTVIYGIVVKSNGKVGCNEFVTIGDKKYYATEDGMTCKYNAYVIGKNLYQFKDSYVDGYPVGEYVKTIATNVKNETWYQFGNQWTYVRDGQVILNGIAEIGGVKYYFSNGVMMTNYLADSSVAGDNSYGYYADELKREIYFGSDGKEVKNRSGWVDGYYYGADHKTSNGWVQVNGKLYYGYSGSGRSEYEVIDGKLYQFDTKTGAFIKEVYKNNGWLQAGSDWFYFENGYAVTGAKTIGKATYAFDDDGRMLKNSLFRDSTYNRYYVNSEGIIDTTPGFRTINGKLYYIDKDGKLASGIRVINGKTYYFEDSYYGYY